MTKLTSEYELLSKQLTALLDGESNFITNLSQFSALIFNSLDSVNWAGFYLLENSEKEKSEQYLQLGPFQGQVACTKIPIGKGVCGTAADKLASQLIDNVDEFPGHIACDSRSRSEIVCPVIADGKLMGVFDLDSPQLKRFNKNDLQGIEFLVKILINKTHF